MKDEKFYDASELTEKRTIGLETISRLNAVAGFDTNAFVEKYLVSKIDTHTGEEVDEPFFHLPVAKQKAWFRLAYPKGRIAHDILKLDESIAVVRASIYLDYNDEHPVADAISVKRLSNNASQRGIEILEWAETAATGRALTDAGFGLQYDHAGEIFDNMKAPKKVDETKKSEATKNKPIENNTTPYEQAKAEQPKTKQPKTKKAEKKAEKTESVVEEKHEKQAETVVESSAVSSDETTTEETLTNETVETTEETNNASKEIVETTEDVNNDYEAILDYRLELAAAKGKSVRELYEENPQSPTLIIWLLSPTAENSANEGRISRRDIEVAKIFCSHHPEIIVN